MRHYTETELKELASRTDDASLNEFVEALTYVTGNTSDPDTLRAAYKRFNPSATEAELEAFVGSRFLEVKGSKDLKEAFIKAGLTPKEAEIAAGGTIIYGLTGGG